MKLQKIINLINQIEISKFYNILTEIISESEESITLEKNHDAEHFVKTFNNEQINKEYKKKIEYFIRNDIMLDIVSDIVIKDGNCIMTRDWFQSLVSKEIKRLKDRIQYFNKILKNKTDIDLKRIRDYNIFLNCAITAYTNDEIRGNECKVSLEELSILQTLKSQLGLSNDEYRILMFNAIGTTELDYYNVDDLITKLRNSGICFYKRKESCIYIPEEITYMIREIRDIKLANKYTRRILKCLDNKYINKIKRNHGIKEKLRHQKIEAIIQQGIDIKKILTEEIYEKNTTENVKKKLLSELIIEKLEIHLPALGRTVNQRIKILIDYFNSLEKDTNIGISKDGFDRMLFDLREEIDNIDEKIKNEFELDNKLEFFAEQFIDYNIKPKDILYLFPSVTLKTFCKKKQISYRGKNLTNAIISNYRESENIYIENYVMIANNDVIGLKNSDVTLKKDIGSTFEEVTKNILSKLGLNVNEELRKKINSRRNSADIIIQNDNNQILIGECKSTKKQYSSFSSATRQIGAYVKHYQKADYTVRGSILISGNFTEDFIQECEKFYDFHLTLIEAQTLLNILEKCKELNIEKFPVNLLRHGLLEEEIVLKALEQ